MKIEILGTPVFEFADYNDWWDRGQKAFAPWIKVHGKDHGVHLFDSQGHLLTCGGDIRIAEENGFVPFKAYDLKRPVPEESGNKWIKISGNETLFEKMAKKNCLCKFDDGTQVRFKDGHPFALMTHFQIL